MKKQIINAVINNDIAVIKILLTENKDLINAVDNDNNSLLMIAINNYNIILAIDLISHGIDINIINNNGEDALKLAQNKGFDYLMYMLLRHKSINKNRALKFALDLESIYDLRDIVNAPDLVLFYDEELLIEILQTFTRKNPKFEFKEMLKYLLEDTYCDEC